MSLKFIEETGWFSDIYKIDNTKLELYGGGSFYDNPDEEIDESTKARAAELAAKYNMVITDSYGKWEGWSEYTPDPGDVSVFIWEEK